MQPKGSWGIIWNVLQMAATTKKVITKCIHHTTCFLKTLLHCAHVPLNVVPKNAQPLVHVGSLGESCRQFGEIDMGSWR